MAVQLAFFSKDSDNFRFRDDQDDDDGGTFPRQGAWVGQQRKRSLRTKERQSLHYPYRDLEQHETVIAKKAAAVAATTTSLETRQPWVDMDLRKDVTHCGVDKCFFPSRTDASIGYLVAGSSNLAVIREAFNFAQKIEENFPCMHTLNLDPPLFVSVTREWLDFLNTIVVQPGMRAQGKPTQPVYATHYDEADLTHAVVQKVRRAPEPHFVLNLGENQDLTWQSLPNFVSHIANPYEFDRRFWREVQCIHQVMRAYPVLYHDFQGLVGADGSFHAMDLDVSDEWKEEKDVAFMENRLQAAFVFLDRVRAQLWTLAFARRQRRAL